MSALAPNYKRKNLSFARGKGSFLITADGKKYLDFVQGIAVNSLGHANPYLVNAINKQSKKIWHLSNVFTIPEQEKLAKYRRRDLIPFITENKGRFGELAHMAMRQIKKRPSE